jgi:hypothetical protein
MAVVDLLDTGALAQLGGLERRKTNASIR